MTKNQIKILLENEEVELLIFLLNQQRDALEDDWPSDPTIVKINSLIKRLNNV